MSHVTTFDRVCQLAAISVLSVTATVAGLVATTGVCLEGSPVCNARAEATAELSDIFNPGATLDAGQVIDRRG